MKPIYLTLISILLTLTSFTQTLQNGGQAQPLPNGRQAIPSGRQAQFKFWLAFEDSIGQRDTVWAIIDSTADANNLDSVFGEVPLGELDSGKFRAYFRYSIDNQLDTTKVYATATFKKNLNIWIGAVNYHLPITVRWDSSLLRNNDLPWDGVYGYLANHFIFTNIQFTPYRFAGLDKFNFIELLPFQQGGGMGNHFPLALNITEEDIYQVGVNNLGTNKGIILYPNPTNRFINIKGLENPKVILYDFSGKVFYSGFQNFIDLSHYLLDSPQILIIQIFNHESAILTKKVVYIP